MQDNNNDTCTFINNSMLMREVGMLPKVKVTLTIKGQVEKDGNSCSQLQVISQIRDGDDCGMYCGNPKKCQLWPELWGQGLAMEADVGPQDVKELSFLCENNLNEVIIWVPNIDLEMCEIILAAYY